MPKPYTPKGKIVPFLAAVKEDPARTWTAVQVAEAIGGKSHGVVAMLTYALRNEALYRGKDATGRMVFRGRPFASKAIEPLPLPPLVSPKQSRAKTASGWLTSEDDPRVPKVVAGWKPPQMIPPRQGCQS